MKARPRTPTVRNKRVSNSRQRRQQHLLDVKVRSRKATQQRNRRCLVFFSKIALAVILGIGLYMGVREGARRLFFENPDYQLRQIEVKTDGTLQREQILEAARLQEGENIFRINLQRVHDALQELPQVDEVQVARQMPGEIDIRIIERKPVAWITSAKEIADPFASDAAFLVDARGVLMREKKLLPEYLGLPVITGCRDESFEAGSAVQSFEARAALELLRLSSGSFMQTRFLIREIDVSSGYSLVVTDKDHTRVTFGYDQMLSQLRRLEQFLVYADDSNRELQTVNLLVQRNIPVTFAEPPAEVINATVDPEGEGPKRIMKATPVFPLPAPSPAKKAEKKKPVTIRRAEPVQMRRAVPARSERKD